jgi:hypothetical protein
VPFFVAPKPLLNLFKFNMIIPLSFRSVVTVSILLSIIFGMLMWRNSKEKKEYDHLNGKITYLDQKLGDLPYRDPGLYRYLKIDSYQYPFEIYTDEQSARIDSLKTGDIVDVYFYQTGDTEKIHLNRFLQFLDKDDKPYFKHRNIIIGLGIVSIAMLVILCIACYVFYKRGKMAY